MVLSISLLFVDLLILPAIFIIWLTKRNYKSKIDWVFQFLFTATYILFIFNTGRWDWVSYYLRYIVSAVFFLSSFFSYKKAKTSPFYRQLNYKRYISLSIIIVLTIVYSKNNFSTIKGFYITEKPLELVFPLKNGTYYISQGGNSIHINHHYTYLPQKYALDIKKLNEFGIRAKGIIPKQLSRYEIFKDILFSPCDGEVVKAFDGRPDMVPLAMDKTRPLGNYVAINHKGTIVYLAHMMKGSLLVKKGDLVKVGQPIGKVGNSGNTSEPHLHMHAQKESQGVPMTFNGKFLVRNTVF